MLYKFRENAKLALTVLILVGLVLGLFVGQFLYDPSWNLSLPQKSHHSADWLTLFHFIGFTIFMGLLKMLIIPLVSVSVIVGVTSVGDFRKLGRLGSWTLLYYLATMLIAASIGLALVTLIQPGAQISTSTASLHAMPTEIDPHVSHGGLLGIFENLLKMMIPENIFLAMAEGQTLAIIVFFIFFGVVTTLIGEKGRLIVRLCEALFEVIMSMVEIVLWLAPLGVFSLMAWTVARVGLGVFGESIGLYMLTVIIGLALHAFVVLPSVLLIFARTNPLRFLHQMRQAIMTAIATDSSSATLPVTMDCATTQADVSPRAAGLVLPLGSTINMDGTALYEAVAVVFIAQAYGVELGMAQLVLIAVTATLAAVGAASIPSAGLVTMVIVVEAVNQSLSAAGVNGAIPVVGIGLIIGVDRLLDMLRTAVNVWGDAVGAKIISELDNKDSST